MSRGGLRLENLSAPNAEVLTVSVTCNIEVCLRETNTGALSLMRSQCFEAFHQEHLEHPVSPAYPAITPQPSPCCAEPSTVVDSHFEGSPTEDQARHGTGKESIQEGQVRVTIDMLPDVSLLEIFDFYVDEAPEEWSILVHVCQTWRNVVFGSPRRLNLRLYCTYDDKISVREKLEIWPPLPIVVSYYPLPVGTSDMWGRWGVDNPVAALEHNDRICEIFLFPIKSTQLEILTALQQPFPALTYLWLAFGGEAVPLDPDSFLGGSAHHLQELHLVRMPFPRLPKLLLSATHLVRLSLWGIPHSGYISPEVMVAGLSVLTRLENFEIGFTSPQSRPDHRRLPPPTRTLLSTLTILQFKGVPEYLEDFVARVDVPLLKELDITFFHRLLFDTQPKLTQLISRAPRFKAHNELRVIFFDQLIWAALPQTLDGPNRLVLLKISCRRPEWQLSSLVQACISSFLRSFIPAVERLCIYTVPQQHSNWQDIESCQWLELLHLFIAVEELYISAEFTPCIAPALQELVGERATEVLPALQALFLEPLPSGDSGPVEEAIEKFIVARQLANHPVDPFYWEGIHI